MFLDPLFSLHGIKYNVYQGLHEVKKVCISYIIQLVNHNIIVLGGLTVEQFFAKPNVCSYIEYISKLSENTFQDEVPFYALPLVKNLKNGRKMKAKTTLSYRPR